MTRNLAPIQIESEGSAGREIRLHFRLFGIDTGPLRALVFHPGDGWQGRR